MSRTHTKAVVQVIVVRLRADGSVRRVRRVIVLPVDIHDTRVSTQLVPHPRW